MLLLGFVALQKPVLDLFVMTGCPISRQYAPAIRDLQAKYSIEVVLIHEDPTTTASQARSFAKEFKLSSKFVLDAHHALAEKYHVLTVPTALLLLKGKPVYEGRIDDRYPALGIQKQRPTKTDLSDAIAAVLAGKPVAEPRTLAIGCAIPPP